MATYNRPMGAVPKGEIRRMNQYVAGGQIFPGDFVSTNSSGQVVAATAGGNALLGAAVSYASASGVNVLIADHPDQEFIISAGSLNSLGVASLTALNLNYDFVANAGSSIYKISRFALLGSSGLASVATLALKALNIDSRDDNTFGTYVDVVVIINNHQLKGGTGTVGT